MTKEHKKKTINADNNENEKESGIETDDTRRYSDTMKDDTKAQSPAVEILTMTEARRRLSSWERATSFRKKKEKIVDETNSKYGHLLTEI